MLCRIFKLQTRVALLHLHFLLCHAYITVEAGHPLPLGCRWVSCKVASVCVCVSVWEYLCVYAATSLASSLPAHELKNMENRSMPCTATPQGIHCRMVWRLAGEWINRNLYTQQTISFTPMTGNMIWICFEMFQLPCSVRTVRTSTMIIPPTSSGACIWCWSLQICYTMLQLSFLALNYLEINLPWWARLEILSPYEGFEETDLRLAKSCSTMCTCPSSMVLAKVAL